jgi:hypothetical protein
MPMTDHLGDRASAFVDGELSLDDRGEVQSHVAQCSACARVIDQVERTRAAVRALPMVEPPFGFYERLSSTSARTRKSRWSRFAWVNVAAGAAVWMLVFVGVSLSGAKSVAPNVGSSVSGHEAAIRVVSFGDNADRAATTSARWSVPAQVAQLKLDSVQTKASLLQAEYTDGTQAMTLYRQRGELDWSRLPNTVERAQVGDDRIAIVRDPQWTVTFVERSPYVYTAVAPAGFDPTALLTGLPEAKEHSWTDQARGAARSFVDCFGLRG